VSGIISLLLSGRFVFSSALICGLYDQISKRIVDALIIIRMVVVVILIAAYLQPDIPVLIMILLGHSAWQEGIANHKGADPFPQGERTIVAKKYPGHSEQDAFIWH
jgi:hypothetical protein